MQHLYRTYQSITVIGHGGVMQAGCQITAHTHVHGFQLRSFLFEEIKIFPYGNGLDRQQGFLAQNVDNNLLHQRKQVRIRLRSGTGSTI